MPRRPRKPATRSATAEALVSQLASGMGKRDARPNVELGRQIAAAQDWAKVAGLVELLSDRDAASDAIKALYECGYVAPALLIPHTDAFFALLNNSKNRLVWGAMIAIACIARGDPNTIWPRRTAVLTAFERGSAITKDAAINTLVALAASSPQRARSLSPRLLEALKACRAKDLPGWTEQVLPVLDAPTRAAAIQLLRSRMREITADGSKRRIEKLLRALS